MHCPLTNVGPVGCPHDDQPVTAEDQDSCGEATGQLYCNCEEYRSVSAPYRNAGGWVSRPGSANARFPVPMQGLEAKGFDQHSKLFRLVDKAYDAMHSLHLELH